MEHGIRGGWGTARDFRETLRNRERGKRGNPGVGEWVGEGGWLVEVGEVSATVGEWEGRKGWQERR